MVIACSVFAVIAIPVVVGMRLFGFGFSSPRGADSFQRAPMEAIVGLIRREAIPPHAEKEYFIADLSAPILAPFDPNSQSDRPGHIWVRKAWDGTLTVVVLTKYAGHAGSYGFAYSDRSLLPRAEGEGWSRLDVPGTLFLVEPSMKIDAHWWEVLNNLD